MGQCSAYLQPGSVQANTSTFRHHSLQREWLKSRAHPPIFRSTRLAALGVDEDGRGGGKNLLESRVLLQRRGEDQGVLSEPSWRRWLLRRGFKGAGEEAPHRCVGRRFQVEGTAGRRAGRAESGARNVLGCDS